MWLIILCTIAFLGAYIFNRPFRHYSSQFLILILKIPVKTLEFIDRKSCAEYYPEPLKITPVKEKPAPKTIAKPIEKPPQPKPQSPDGLPNFDTDDLISWQKWFEEHPEMVKNNKKVNILD